MVLPTVVLPEEIVIFLTVHYIMSPLTSILFRQLYAKALTATVYNIFGK